MVSACTTAPRTPPTSIWIISLISRMSFGIARPSRFEETATKHVLVFRDGAWQTRRVLLGLFPELDTPGGVQRAGRHVAAVMSEFAASHGMECRLLSLNDSRELHRMSVGTREFMFTGSARGKLGFSATAARAAR